MARHPLARTVLLMLLGFVAATAIVGGIFLMIGSLWPEVRTALSPPESLLVGSPFASYLLPGAVLAGVVGGLHAAAFVAVLRRHRRATLVSAVAAYAVVIWIIVQMTIIPFSPLQALYVVLGLAELGIVLLILGVLRPESEAVVRVSEGVSGRI